MKYARTAFFIIGGLAIANSFFFAIEFNDLFWIGLGTLYLAILTGKGNKC